MTLRPEDVFQHLADGKTRDEIAQMYGYKARRYLDQFMMRRGYQWSVERQTYVERVTPKKKRRGHKVARVIEAFQAEPYGDPKRIAEALGFGSAFEMAQYMQSHGYLWSNTARNYVAQDRTQEAPLPSTEPDSARQTASSKGDTVSLPLGDALEILGMLVKHRAKLEQLLLHTERGATDVPRYTIPGLSVVKSLHISVELDRLLRSASQAWRMSQREILEAAIIEFLRKHGYDEVLQRLLTGHKQERTS
ncbi:MAG: hypothetical protein K6T76_09425 [Alicyclobacillus mali]|uniref:hypothetical protein n=1 Tax=Alicyclobacillus mali (ex Roth et al. 2021) TaxID=1123961 RepID=UPI0023F21233|nr:hypothetical protein [Alicyclobacillus mali (ex Roth et al. 2021)]MCL6489141.1 hypothetical protein [Alicyclobacillus mali (ex Roth et al. 2021)]